MYTKIMLEQIDKAREEFFEKNNPNISNINPVILQSWIRSKNAGVNTISQTSKILSRQELDLRIKKRQLLYSTALPIMNSLYNFVRDSGFIITLTDEEGYILKLIGDKDIKEKASSQQNPLVEGSNRSENIVGTNSIGTVLATKEPLQLYASEHYCTLHFSWTCSGAPIFSPEGNCIGVLCLSGTCNNAHLHTLGMAVSAATSITQQIYLNLAHQKTMEIKNQLKTALETLQNGTLLLNKDLKITQINTLASQMLQIEEKNLLHQEIGIFLKDIDFKNITSDLYNLETTLYCKNSNKKIFVSIHRITYPIAQKCSSFLVLLKEAKKIHKFVNNFIGSQAHFTFDDIIGNSPAIQQAKRISTIAAKNHSNVLLCGESGTGKELFAQSIHNYGPSKNGPFVAINCGALPRTLLESELFGYEPGAFTGAKKEGHIGKFELAEGGTIFLDEIGDMPYDIQVSLLRILQNKEIVRIGASRATPINVRIIAATNKDLEKAMEEKTFREDLYYRLNVFNISIPSLSERKEDILDLAYYFIEKYKQTDIAPSLDDSVCKIFMNYPWPGNIRELENIIERACLITSGPVITPDSLPYNMVKRSYKTRSETSIVTKTIESSDSATVDEMEKALIINHLIKEKGNLKRASESLGISRRTLYRKLEKYRIAFDELRTE